MKEGDEVVVVDSCDDISPHKVRIGARGVVLEKLPYQGIGDDPKVDPLWLVDLGRKLGRKRRTFFWTEELEVQGP